MEKCTLKHFINKLDNDTFKNLNLHLAYCIPLSFTAEIK